MAKKNDKYQQYKTGDIFSFKISEQEYGFGQVILDVYNQGMKRGLIDKSSRIYFGTNETILIDVFKYTSIESTFDPSKSERLIPGLFTSHADILLGYWQIIGDRPIDTKKIDFPEFLSHQGQSKGQFTKGEVSVSIEMDFQEVESLALFPTEISSINVPKFAAFLLGKNDDQKMNLGNHDIRFSKEKEKIYSKLPEEFKQDYYSLSSSKGFDIERFYK